MSIVELTKQNFDETIDNNDIVLIDFWASWCQPCLAFADVYELCAKNNPDVVFGKVNIEEQPELAEDFSVRSIPLLMVIRQSVAVFSESGSMPETTLLDLIKQARALDMDEVRQALLDQQS